MIALRNIHDIIYLLSLIIAYFIAETFSGWFQALVAKKMGDSTPEHYGFLTLNPLVHVDPIGMLFLLLVHFGWGKPIPLNPFNIERPFKDLKLIATFFANSFAHFTIALISLILLLLKFGAEIIDLIKPIIFYRAESLPLLATYFHKSSSLTLSIAVILVSIIFLSLILGVINLIHYGFQLFMFVAFNETRGQWHIELLIPILLIIFFSYPIQIYVLDVIISVAHFLVHIAGIL